MVLPSIMNMKISVKCKDSGGKGEKVNETCKGELKMQQKGEVETITPSVLQET